ncbi:uncharacterized protein LOC117179704 isoform X4 [Belonocnema kinseyi]|uniref:uncharacterized protein LOC117179704 isoform X4 n=1 Tax=Belonocnema kinseyi TaxID=2817044 RepID=UPI00143D01FE|nr:uncharacterized protein LOC117179704 isoform X4 [Belonocnema kinseyi]
MKLLETKVESEGLLTSNDVIYYGFFILHLMKDVPKLFGNISKKIVQMASRSGVNQIHIVFNRYFSPPIKDYEHELRNANDSAFEISGPDQVRPADFSKELKNSKFKESLVRFLINDWARDEFAPFIGSKTILINFDYCYRFEALNSKVIRAIDNGFSYGSHEEADTKIVYHLSRIDVNCNVLIRCFDTDILIILLGNMKKICSTLKVWLKVGVGNSQRHINVTKLYEYLREPLSSALPGYNALSGCDFNPACFRKGKSRPWKIIENSLKYQEAFSNLSEMHLSHDTFAVIEEFVCQMYGMPNVKTVNEARIIIFNKNYKAKSKNESFREQVRNYDASNLLPCQSELRQQLLRTRYIMNLWGNACLERPTDLSPHEHGWSEKDRCYEFVWFTGDQLQKLVDDIIVQPVDEDSSNEKKSDAENDVWEASSDMESDDDDGITEFDYDCSGEKINEE